METDKDESHLTKLFYFQKGQGKKSYFTSIKMGVIQQKGKDTRSSGGGGGWGWGAEISVWSPRSRQKQICPPPPWEQPLDSAPLAGPFQA